MESFGVFRISASALEAQRQRMNAIASNMANVHTTRTAEGGPYRRQDVIFGATEPALGSAGESLTGVKVLRVVQDTSPPTTVYDPGHPDADGEGYVDLPNVDAIKEMVNMMMALRAYEANVSTFNISKDMVRRALTIGR